MAVSNTDYNSQLDACLEVLAEAVDSRSYPGTPAVDFTELTTALWQTIELVSFLRAENDYAWGLYDDLSHTLQAQAREQQRASVGKIIAPSGKLIMP